MSTLLFPDNTVLVNFALIGRIDLFGQLVDGRGSWTNTIAEECARSSRVAGLESLSRIPDLFGFPLVPTPRERIDSLTIRELMAVPGDSDTQHLGEAEAVAIISARDLTAVFVTDDRHARRIAGRYGIRTCTTGDLIRLAVRAELIERDAGWDLVLALRSMKRHVPGMPGDREGYDRWIDG